METPKSKDRIPYESLDDASVVSAWDLPTVATKSRLVRSAKHEKNGDKKPSNEKIETVKKNKKAKPLTVEELHEITESARKDGFQQGLKEGTEQGIREGTKVGEKTGQQRAYMEAKKEIEALQHQLRQVTSRLFEPMEKQDQTIENILVDLVVQLTQHIVASEIQSKPSRIVSLVKHVIEDLPKSAKNTRVRLCDSDADLIEKLVPENQREWNILRDSALASGGCIVETDSSLIDYSVESRLRHYLEKVSESSIQVNTPVPNYVESFDESDTSSAHKQSPEQSHVAKTAEAEPLNKETSNTEVSAKLSANKTAPKQNQEAPSAEKAAVSSADIADSQKTEKQTISSRKAEKTSTMDADAKHD